MQLVEVGPRDGLQAEERVLATADKVALIRRCVAAGVTRIEVASFVHPKLVPTMADAEDVVAAIGSPAGVSTIGLVLNRRGLDRALATAVDEVNFVVAASEGYSRHNANASVDETMTEVEAMLPDAVAAGRAASVTISVAFGDPFDGEVPLRRVAGLAARAAEAGAGEIALGDTVGAGTPPDVVRRIAAVRDAAPGVRLRSHFHNTRNTGYANAVAAVEAGVDALDAAVGGFGGSPFAPGAGGNVATEDLAHLLERMGVPTGLDPMVLAETAAWLGDRLGAPVPGMLAKAGPFPPLVTKS